MKSGIIATFSLIMLSNFAFSWGMTGHRVVGEIATHHLSKNAKKEIARILRNESLAHVSNWMDDIKSDKAYDSLKPWHYTTIPDGKKYAETEINPKGDVVHGIEFVVNALKSGKLSPNLELDYLRILVHLVGDIHQPLHVGRGDDKGGNDVKLEWFWESSNLHRVWDSGMIESMAYSYTELTDKINHPTKDQVAQWQSTSVYDWAHEAMTFRAQIYDLPENLKINYEYRFKNWEVVENQLLKGGIRLAGILNEIYG